MTRDFSYQELLELFAYRLMVGYVNPKDVAINEFFDWVEQKILEYEIELPEEDRSLSCPSCRRVFLRSQWLKNFRKCAFCKFRFNREIFYKKLTKS